MTTFSHREVLMQLVDCDHADENDLHENERSLLRSMRSEKARRGFIAGRIAAHKLMQQLGAPEDFALLRNADKSPRWPPGFIGSISHTDNAAAAALARTSGARALGIDIEACDRAIDPRTQRKILSGKESDWVDAVPAEKRLRLLAIFSAKEAIYKALAPIGGGRFYFSDVEMTCGGQDKHTLYSFDARVNQDILSRCGLQSGPRVDVLQRGAYLLGCALCEISGT